VQQRDVAWLAPRVGQREQRPPSPATKKIVTQTSNSVFDRQDVLDVRNEKTTASFSRYKLVTEGHGL
jgi:hypothetical protein